MSHWKSLKPFLELSYAGKRRRISADVKDTKERQFIEERNSSTSKSPRNNSLTLNYGYLRKDFEEYDDRRGRISDDAADNGRNDCGNLDNVSGGGVVDGADDDGAPNYDDDDDDDDMLNDDVPDDDDVSYDDDVLDDYDVPDDDDHDNDYSDANLSQIDFSNRIRNWSVKFNITNVALSALLCILKTHKCHGHLPSDARTFKHTPSKVVLRSVDPGYYTHFGIADGLQRVWDKVVEGVTCIKLVIGIDGLPLFGSSSGDLWPILASISNVPSLAKVVIPIGIYYGPKKPESIFVFLKEFIEEITASIREGVFLGGKKVQILVDGICCDAPAKSFILGTKGHNGYSSCTRCKQYGNFFENRMTFPDMDFELRTNQEFMTKEDEDYHVGDTPLTVISGLDLTKSVIMDYMHLVCLGVVRTFLSIWIFAKAPLKFPHQTIHNISLNLCSLQSFIPYEFCRKPRRLEEIKRWKATEFRQFLLYTGPLVLKDILLPDHQKIYNLFLSLHVAMTILLSPQYYRKHNADAKQLLKYFVENFKTIYGQKYITHNFHGLLHISDDAIHFDCPLDHISAFKFENFLQMIKHLVRKGDKPLQQVAKRIGEMNFCNQNFHHKDLNNDSNPVFTFEQSLSSSNSFKSYKYSHFGSFKLSNSLPNNCCLLSDGNIVLIDNFVIKNANGEMGFFSKKFRSKSNFYSLPVESCNLGIYKVESLEKESEYHKIDDIKKKTCFFKTEKCKGCSTIAAPRIDLHTSKLDKPLFLGKPISRIKEVPAEMDSYAIVKFVNERGSPTDVIPTSWLTPDDLHCFYPNSTSKIRNLIIKRSNPAGDWNVFPVKVLKKYKSYNDARLHLPKSVYTSNLESDECEEGLSKRKRFKSTKLSYPDETMSDDPEPEERYDNESESSFPVLNTFTPDKNEVVQYQLLQVSNATFPNPDSIVPSQAFQLVQVASTSSFDASPEPEHIVCSPQPEQLVGVANTSSNDSSPEPTPPLVPTPQPSSQGVTIDLLYRTILTMQASIESLYNEVKMYNSRQGHQMAESPDDQEILDWLLKNLPINERQTFEEFEKKLIDPKIRMRVVKHLASIGGADIRSHTNNILRRLFTDILLTQYSYTGKKGFLEVRTDPFVSTKICAAIHDTLKKCYKATDEDIKKHISAFLNQAKTRAVRKEKKIVAVEDGCDNLDDC